MDHIKMAQASVDEAIYLLRNKPHNSTLVERYFLLYEAWDKIKDKPQPIAQAEGLKYILERASLPISENDLLLGRFDDHVPTAEEERKLQELWQTNPSNCPVSVSNGGHVVLDFKGLVRVGLTGLLRKAKERLDRAVSNNEGMAALNYLSGVIGVYEAILIYIERYRKAALEVGREDMAEVCEAICKGEPRSFRQALQLILFIYNIYLIYAGREVACLNFGRIDNYLLSLYEDDIKNGRMTREQAGSFIDDLSAKMSLHLGRGEHQMAYLNADYEQTGWLRNPVYDSPGYIVLGGKSNLCDHRENPLTLLFAEHIHPELKNPIYVCRHTDDVNSQLWQILCEKVAQNASLLMYNDETAIPAYLHIGIKEEDAINYSIFPCNWASLDGCMSNMGVADRHTLPAIINQVLEADTEYKNIDEIIKQAGACYMEYLKVPFENYRAFFSERKYRNWGGLGLADCFLEDCVEKTCGISKYPTIYTLLRNIGTATDMLAAVNELVFKQKYCTLEELKNAAKEDFESRPDILAKCRKAAKYGTDNDAADSLAAALMTEILDRIDEAATNKDGKRDVYTLNVTINDSHHIAEGKQLGSTVDGRLKGTPISENLSGTVGTSKGATGLLRSVAKLPFDRMHSGVLNLRLSKSMVKGDRGVDVISALIHSYFEMGGMQLQVSIADTEELKAAQKTPEEYKDLLVRITGYSAVFTDMSKGAQDEFIRREELK